MSLKKVPIAAGKDIAAIIENGINSANVKSAECGPMGQSAYWRGHMETMLEFLCEQLKTGYYLE